MKITSKELREGNKIRANNAYEGKIMTFDRFNEDKTVCFFSDGSKWDIGEYLEDCEPVVLTSEILLACGFEFKKHPYSVRYICDDFELEQQGKYFAYVLWGGEDAPHLTQYIGHCEYLHSLQNLYFSIRKEELIFNPKLL